MFELYFFIVYYIIAAIVIRYTWPKLTAKGAIFESSKRQYEKAHAIQLWLFSPAAIIPIILMGGAFVLIYIPGMFITNNWSNK